MNNNITACPLDCYDACSIVYKDEKIQATKEGHTKGFLCPHLNKYETVKRINSPRYKGKKISMSEALLKLKEILKGSPTSRVLHYKGHGNFGLMQDVTEHFFAQYGAVLTDGTLCDGAGEAGILEGRGSNKNMPLSQIEKSEVVILWGRNPHTTSSHLLPALKGKTIIVIDPLKTQIAKTADLFIQIKPHTDAYLAMLLCRFLYINDDNDTEFASEFEEYYELTQTIREKSTLDNMGVSLGDIEKILEYVNNKKVAIVCGIGIQKYRDGGDVLRAIDTFAAVLGLFGKEGCGVAYLGNSKENIQSLFTTKAKRVSVVDTAFDAYKTVFIQGANPLAQMPDSLRVQKAVEQTQNVVYFGLYENETSAVADLIIPAKTFLEKDDIRTSYSHHAILPMQKQIQSDIGISEYDLSAYLCREFAIEIEEEKKYLTYFESFAEDGVVKGREDIPYQDGFDTDDGEFLFLEEIEVDKKLNKIVMSKNKDKVKKVRSEFSLITPKSPKSLNSQFIREEFIYLHSDLGYGEGEEVKISSSIGSVMLKVKHNDDIRKDCVLIYSGTRGVNNLTSALHSYEGNSAAFQELEVFINAEENK